MNDLFEDVVTHLSLGLSSPQKRLRMLRVFGGLWLVIWTIVAIFPNYVSSVFWHDGFNWLAIYPVIAIFFASVLSADAFLLHISEPRKMDNLEKTGFLRDLAHQESSKRKRLKLIFSVLFGLIHVSMLAGVCGYLTANQIHLFG